MDPALTAAVTTLIGSSPSLAVAVWTILRQDKRIDKLLESQKWLIEQLMALHPPQSPEKDQGPDLALPPS